MEMKTAPSVYALVDIIIIIITVISAELGP